MNDNFKQISESLEKALKLAYKYASGDMSVGQEEAMAVLCDALCNLIGNDKVCDFIENEVEDYLISSD